MDKYIEVLCKQNPKISFPCGNPDCKRNILLNQKMYLKTKPINLCVKTAVKPQK